MGDIGPRDTSCDPKAGAMDGLSALVLWVIPVYVLICEVCE